MNDVKSFVRRNSRMTDSHRRHITSHGGRLHTMLPYDQLRSASFVGLEIGFGMGDSLIDIAKNNPDQLWLGIEVYEIGVSSVIRRAKEQNITNIIVLVGDATVLLADKEAYDLFDHVRVFFPDPWPKKRHQKRRLLQKEFIDHLTSLMAINGVVHIATDNLDYAQGCKLLLAASEQLVVQTEKPHRTLTKFARKAIAKGVMISDIVAKKLR